MGDFPRLTPGSYRIASPPTVEYNCVAWAAGDTRRWWWPDAMDLYFWPAGASREETIEAFIAVFTDLGFEPCDNADPEDGFQKIAIYANVQSIPTHAARQLPSGSWTSKIGGLEDIEHETLNSLEGPLYGSAVRYLKRPYG